MARDIISTTLSITDGRTVDAVDFDRRASEAIDAHRANAISNYLPFDEANEATIVTLFSKLVREGPFSLPVDLPAWDQLEEQFAGCLTDLLSAVESQSTVPGSTQISS